MGGTYHALLATIVASVAAGICAVVLSLAAAEADDVSVKTVLGAYAALLAVAASGQCLWLAEWWRAETPLQHAKTTNAEVERRESAPQSLRGDLHLSVRSALSQPAYASILVRMIIINAVANYFIEKWILGAQDDDGVALCQRIPFAGLPSIWQADADVTAGRCSKRNGDHLSVVGETLFQGWMVAFCVTLFSFGDIQRGVLGQPWNFKCTQTRVPPWILPCHDDLLETWWVRPWATGRTSARCRKFIWLRAFAIAAQVTCYMALPLTLLVLLVYELHWTSWDGGMDPSFFLVLCIVWKEVVAFTCVTIGYLAATSESTVIVLRERYEWQQQAHRRSEFRQSGMRLDTLDRDRTSAMADRTSKFLDVVARNSFMVAEMTGVADDRTAPSTADVGRLSTSAGRMSYSRRSRGGPVSTVELLTAAERLGGSE